MGKSNSRCTYMFVLQLLLITAHETPIRWENPILDAHIYSFFSYFSLLLMRLQSAISRVFHWRYMRRYLLGTQYRFHFFQLSDLPGRKSLELKTVGTTSRDPPWLAQVYLCWIALKHKKIHGIQSIFRGNLCKFYGIPVFQCNFFGFVTISQKVRFYHACLRGFQSILG